MIQKLHLLPWSQARGNFNHWVLIRIPVTLLVSNFKHLGIRSNSCFWNTWTNGFRCPQWPECIGHKIPTGILQTKCEAHKTEEVEENSVWNHNERSSSLSNSRFEGQVYRVILIKSIRINSFRIVLRIFIII